MSRLTSLCQEIYYGLTPRALRARYLLLVFDLFVISYFVTTTFMDPHEWVAVVDVVLAILLIADFLGRMIAQPDRLGFLVRPLSLVDFVVIASLIAPATAGNFAFLRIVRALRLLRSYAVIRELRGHSRFFARNEEVIYAALNLIVFIFILTAVVFVLQVQVNDSINNYIDALYFTITTLTTTGFGDIILVGSQGRMLAVVIMIAGFALFLRLIQSIFRPSTVRYECLDCGLARHDRDAVHCKHCGRQLHIRTEGIMG
ncbi:MAG TPA: ion transporter [Gammaproteobacteria bacterium]